MGVPTFQKGEIFTLKEIAEIVSSTDEEELEAYLHGEFEYKGINPNP